MAEMQLAAGKAAQAAFCYEELILLAPNHPDLHVRLAEVRRPCCACARVRMCACAHAFHLCIPPSLMLMNYVRACRSPAPTPAHGAVLGSNG